RGREPGGRVGDVDGGLGHVRQAACAMSAKIELNHRIHVLTRKEELDGIRVPGKVVVVLDILFATTTMVAALAHGATEVIPVDDEKAARNAGATAAMRWSSRAASTPSRSCRRWRTAGCDACRRLRRIARLVIALVAGEADQ